MRQTLNDFEWVVVDDGSTDETQAVLESLEKDGGVRMRVFIKSNGGKHTALNVAVREASGELFTVIDSDDWLEPKALERMKQHWDRLPTSEQSRMKGVCGHFAYENGKVVGDLFPGEKLVADDLDLRLRYRVDGDKIGFTRIDVMREFPFPEDICDAAKGSVRLVPESLVWHRMGRKYPTLFVNEVFAYKEYQRGGLTDRSRLLEARNSRASLVYVTEILMTGRQLPWKFALKFHSNYYRHSLHEGLRIRDQIRKLPSRKWSVACVPIGMWLWWNDRRLFAREERGRSE